MLVNRRCIARAHSDGARVLYGRLTIEKDFQTENKIARVKSKPIFKWMDAHACTRMMVSAAGHCGFSGVLCACVCTWLTTSWFQGRQTTRQWGKSWGTRYVWADADLYKSKSVSVESGVCEFCGRNRGGARGFNPCGFIYIFRVTILNEN